ncbi:MAG: outer membrane lipoprotein carrier protein LolA [Deltaproteobacteria bacterium]|nr:outer membrane lipoprotein carrier protein LolA [Deltaproteobacteria bacterium]MBW2305446.1 outer membrane lipoprotein carrier protein LolA [Deltaproteobacteria bacterium]
MRNVLFGIVATAGLVLLPINSAGAITLDELVDQVRHRYANIRTLEASFEQRNYQSATDDTLWFHGKLYFMKPHNLRIQVNKPDNQIIIMDSYRLWIHIPLLNQVIIQPRPRDINSQILLSMLMGEGDPRKDFHVSWTKSDAPDAKGRYRIGLRPISPQKGMDRIEVAVDSKTYYMVGFRLSDRLGNRQDFEIKDITINQPLSQELFRMEIPKGTTVITPHMKNSEFPVTPEGRP